MLAWHWLFSGEQKTQAAFLPYLTNATWSAARILSIAECLRMGWPCDLNLLEAFYMHPLPPPAANLPTETIRVYWFLANSHRALRPGHRAVVAEEAGGSGSATTC